MNASPALSSLPILIFEIQILKHKSTSKHLNEAVTEMCDGNMKA